MYGNVFEKIDGLRAVIARFASGSDKAVTYNRLYLSGEDIQLNISIDKVMYLITADDNGYEVSKRDNKASKTEKHRVQYDSIQNGSFLGLFKT